METWLLMKNKFFIVLLLTLGFIGLTIYLILGIMKTMEIDSFDFDKKNENEDF